MKLPPKVAKIQKDVVQCLKTGLKNWIFFLECSELHKKMFFLLSMLGWLSHPKLPI